MSDLIGSTLQGYRVEAEIGRGGQAVVYRATQLSLQRVVALKVVAPSDSDPAFLERFTREGITAAGLDHPHIIPVVEAGRAEGLAFLAMKFIDGPSLETLLRAPGGIEARRALAICGQVAEALDYLSALGMVHRDVTPANILLGPGDHAYLSDFGLSHAVAQSRPARTGTWVGTVGYAAPEQIRGDAVNAAVDRYALAAVAFRCLTGGPVFPGDRDTALRAHLTAPPPAASARNPSLGPLVDGVLAHGLATDPAATAHQRRRAGRRPRRRARGDARSRRGPAGRHAATSTTPAAPATASTASSPAPTASATSRAGGSGRSTADRGSALAHPRDRRRNPPRPGGAAGGHLAGRWWRGPAHGHHLRPGHHRRAHRAAVELPPGRRAAGHRGRLVRIGDRPGVGRAGATRAGTGRDGTRTAGR